MAVRVSRRSSGSFGADQIKFSCCDNQPTEFMKMSRLPSIPSTLFEAKSESPKTTTRVSGFGASGLSPGLAGSAAAADTAEASVIGPGLSFPGSRAIFLGQERLDVAFGPTPSLVVTSGWAVCPFTPPSTGVTERDSGYAVITLNRSVIYAVDSWPRPERLRRRQTADPFR